MKQAEKSEKPQPALFGSFEKDNREYVTGKFRHPGFPENCGLDNDAVSDGVVKLAEENKQLPSALLKAKAFRYVCETMQLDINPQDFFPAFGCWVRGKKPLSAMLNKRESAIRTGKLKSVWNLTNCGHQAGAWFVYLDINHSAPDWEFAIGAGFPGILERAKRYRRLHEEKGTLTQETADFLDSVIQVHQCILDTLARFRHFGQERYPGNRRVEFVCSALARLQENAPSTFYEALLFIYMHFMFGEYIDRFQERTLGNLDVLLDPFYQRDLKAGIMTETQARELLDYFLMQWGSIDNPMGQPFYLGGTNPDGSSRFNPLSVMILEEFDKLHIPTPKIQLKVAKNTPDSILDLTLDMIRRGNSSLVFVCEEAIMRSMLRLGYTIDEAREFDVTGCYEYGVRGNENVTQSLHCNIPKAVELALNNGIDPITKVRCGIPNCGVENMKDFSDFYDAFLRQLAWQIGEITAFADAAEPELVNISPALLFSGTIEHCLQVGRDAYSTGCKYNTTMLLLVGFGSAVDSLMAVRELVYEKKLVSLPELREILYADWFRHEDLRQKAIHSRHRYGSGDPDTEFMAENLAGYLSNLINLRPNTRGGFWVASGHPARKFIELGKLTGATPDGRKSGVEFSKNLSPSIATDTHGVTAMINSVTKTDSANMPGNFTLDVMLHPTGVTGSDGLAAMKTLLRIYFKHYGLAMQFNVCSPEILRDAQNNPAKYPSLQVRVCGWNVRFNDLAHCEQDAYIERCSTI